MFDLPSIDLSSLPSTPILPARPLLEHDTGDDYILRIDNSSLEKLQTCPRSALYYLVKRRERQGSSALVFGGAIHEALEYLYKHDFTLPSMASAISIAHDFMQNIVLRPNDHRTPEMVTSVISSYASHYCPTGERDLIPLDHEGSPAVEIPFSLSLGEIELNSEIDFTGEVVVKNGQATKLYIRKLYIMWSGKIDLLCNHMGEAAVSDHKTSSMAGQTFYDQFRLSQPVHGYVWAAQKIFGIPIHTFLLNALFIRKPTKTGRGIEFERRAYYMNDFHINEWQRDVMHEIENFVHCLSTGYFPKAPVWCMGKYGACPYFDVCTLADEKQRDTILDSDMFMNVTWSPLAKEESKSTTTDAKEST